MEEKKKKLTGQQGELMRALEISVDDLIANDEGYITEAQRTSLPKREAYQWIGQLIISSIIGSVLLFILLPMILTAMREIHPATLSNVTFLFLVTVFIAWHGFISYNRLKNDLLANKLHTVQGIAVINKGRLEINGLKLNASPDVLSRVLNLAPYIVHYLPNSKVILSMEHISDDDNIRQDERSSRLQDADISSEPLGANYDNSAENRQQSG